MVPSGADPAAGIRRLARTRLRVAMAVEAKRTARRRFVRRWLVVGLVTVLVLGISPTGPDGDTAPLVGLADAVAQDPPPHPTSGRHWYAVSRTRELIVVADGDGRPLEFMATVVEESWHDTGDVPRRRVTYQQPGFFSAEDEDRFHASRLGAVYGAGRTLTVSAPPEHATFIAAIDQASPEELSGALRRRVAGLGDRRMEEVRLLQLAAELIEVHADDSARRAEILRVIADIPGIMVVPGDRNVVVSIDYVDGDRPLRLMYEFDGDTAHLVGEYLAALATQSEPASVLRSTRHSLPTPAGVSGS